MNVFITGPARGIGAALARRLASQGARVSLAGMEPQLLETLARELGPQHVWFECDVTKQSAVQHAVDQTVRAFGAIDVVVANAGIATHGTVATSPIEALARVVDVNLTGVIRTVHVTLPYVVASRGYFLLISSAAAIAAGPGLATYSATKAGVEHFGNSLRLELLHKGVAVGVAHPSWIDTDLVRDARRDLASFDRAIHKFPGPFGKVTPLETCIDMLASGIARRERKIYIPKSLKYMAWIRQFFSSPYTERDMGKRSYVEARENEAAQLGRAFGEHSVESRRDS